MHGSDNPGTDNLPGDFSFICCRQKNQLLKAVSAHIITHGNNRNYVSFSNRLLLDWWNKNLWDQFNEVAPMQSDSFIYMETGSPWLKDIKS